MSSVDSTSSSKILLTTSNWHVWMPQMRRALRKVGLWGHIDGTDAKPVSGPAGGAPAPTQRDLRLWYRDENSTIGEILDVCEPGLRSQVEATADGLSAAELWSTLQDKYGKPSLAVMAGIKFSISLKTCSEGGSVQDHASWLQQENNKLAGSKLEYDDLNLAIQLLAGLPRSMQSIRQVIVARPPEQITFENVRAALIEFEHTEQMSNALSRLSMTPGPADTPSAFAATGRPSNNRPRTGKYCSLHGTDTHSDAECRSQQPGSNNFANKKSNDNIGHPNGKAKPESANSSTAEQEDDDEPDEDIYFVSTDLGSSNSEESTALTATTMPVSPTAPGQTATCTVWMVDSAATLHVCRSNDCMTNYAPTSGKRVRLGDGRHLQIAGIGNIRALMQHEGSAPTLVTLTNVRHVPGLAVNLLSVACMDSIGLTTTFAGGKCSIRNQQRKIIAEAHLDRTGHYALSMRPLPDVSINQVSATRSATPASRLKGSADTVRLHPIARRVVTPRGVTLREKEGWSSKLSEGRGGATVSINRPTDASDTSNTSHINSPHPLSVSAHSDDHPEGHDMINFHQPVSGPAHSDDHPERHVNDDETIHGGHSNDHHRLTADHYGKGVNRDSESSQTGNKLGLA
jgi:hypothetical protein